MEAFDCTAAHLGVPTVQSGIATIAIEARALEELQRWLEQPALGDAFARAARLIAQASGRVIVSGIGKSGLIARKISATLASTGTPSFYVHPSDASHGDLGAITVDDVVLLLSWSGESTELSDIVTFCRRFGVALIVMTSQAGSTLGGQANIALVMPPVQEACPNRLAPTTSSITQLALGDALAVALIEQRGFSPDDFRIFHPKGRLAAQLVTVADLMSVDEAVPKVSGDATILQATIEMSRKRFGVTAVTDQEDRLSGAFTDGDLRRSVAVTSVDARVQDHMTLRPHTISPRVLASEALAVMNANNISQLFVCGEGKLVGIVHLHDVLRAGVA